MPKVSTQTSNPSVLRQRGAAFLLTMSAILGALTIMAVSFASIAVQKKVLEADAENRQQIGEVLDLIGFQLLDLNSPLSIAVAAGSGEGLSDAEVRAALGRPYSPLLRAAISSPVVSCDSFSTTSLSRCVSWSRFAAWLPAGGVSSGMSFQIDPQAESLEGLPASQIALSDLFEIRSNRDARERLLIDKEDRLTKIAANLRAWYSAKRSMNPYLAASKNFWTPTSCLNPGPNELGCRTQTDFLIARNSNTDFDARQLMRILGASENELFIGSPYVITYRNVPLGGNSLARSLDLRLHSTRADLFIHILIPNP